MNNVRKLIYKKKKKNTEVKKACYYFRQIKTVKQIMALKDITKQNPEPPPKNLKFVKIMLI